MSRPVSLAWLVLAIGLVTSTGASASAQFDVSYVWASNLDNVKAYREQVAQVLGPEVSRNLRVAPRDGRYGVIYLRHGDSQTAVQLAQAHTMLLQSRGLEAAAAIPSDNWNFIEPGAPESTAVSVTAGNERLPEFGDLSAIVNSQIQEMRRRGQVASDERTAWSVYDFTTGQKLVSINEDVPLQAASLIKPFVALAFFHKVKNDELIYGPKSRQHMQQMLQHSSNSSTNWVMRHVGGPDAVQAILKQHYGGIFADTSIMEYIPASGRTYRNRASAHDYSRFLYALWNDSIPSAQEIKRLMSLPGPNRLTTGTGTADIPRETSVYNKTGSTAMLCGDIGILVIEGRDGRHYPYTVVGIIEKDSRAPDYNTWIHSRGDVIRRVSNLVYNEVSRRHGLRATVSAAGGG